MAKIKFIGEQSRVIAGTRMFKGDTRDLNEKLVAGLRGDPDVVILGEQAVEIEQLPISSEPLPVEGEISAPEALWNPDEVLTAKENKPVRKSRGKRK